MRKMFFLFASLIALVSANFYPAKASADNARDNFFPVAQVVLTPVFFSDEAGFSALMEGGPRSYRFNGTIGFLYCEQHKFKMGGEYLSQKLDFRNHHHYDGDDSSTHHHKRDWVHQWAVGGKYQYAFTDDCCNWLKYFQVDGYYAKSKNREHHHGVDTGFHRRIVGAKSWGIEVGSAIDTYWNNGELYVGIGYDEVRFNRRHDYFDDVELSEHHHKDVSGVGASIALNQPLWYDMILGVKYQYTRAYDYLETMLNWTNRMECGDIDLGLFYNYVWGKQHIPSSNTFGVTVGFTFGMDNFSFFGDCCAPYDTDCCVADCSDLAKWIADPAVYMPQVIAKSEHYYYYDGEGEGSTTSVSSSSSNSGSTSTSNPTATNPNAVVADVTATGNADKVVAEGLEPVNNTAAPVAAPVVEGVLPVVSNTAAPVVAPVVEGVLPVVSNTAAPVVNPVVNTVSPVVTNAETTVEPVANNVATNVENTAATVEKEAGNGFG